MKITHNLKPIYNKNSKVLILGTMPSVISRNACFYYANPQNRFWSIVEKLFNVELKNNKEKEMFLLKNNIALWDVIKACDINASDDASIKNIEVNDIRNIINRSNIKKVFCTGKKAYNIFCKYFPDISVIYLPSPSSANARKKLDDLVEDYKIIKKYLNA